MEVTTEILAITQAIIGAKTLTTTANSSGIIVHKEKAIIQYFKIRAIAHSLATVN